MISVEVPLAGVRMTNLLRGVVQRGTAAVAASLEWPLAGKTGTVDDYTDAWFVGFDPNITVGVWVGYDEKKPIGNGETGAVTALPMWIDFMKRKTSCLPLSCISWNPSSVVVDAIAWLFKMLRRSEVSP